MKDETTVFRSSPSSDSIVIALSAAELAPTDEEHDDINAFLSLCGENQIHIAGTAEHDFLFFTDSLYRFDLVAIFRCPFEIEGFRLLLHVFCQRFDHLLILSLQKGQHLFDLKRVFFL